MSTPERRCYPPGPATLLGQELMLDGTDPLIMLTTADRTRTFWVSGGLAPWPRYQDGLSMVEISPPTADFANLNHQGARQNGITYSDTVYDAMEFTIIAVAHATTPEGLSRVVSEWMAANTPEKLCRTEWLTPDSGLWWIDHRLAKPWPDRITNSPRRQRKQVVTTVVSADLGFWCSVDSVCVWRYTYDATLEKFTADTSADGDLGAWPQYRYSGAGTGNWTSKGDGAYWVPGSGEVSVLNGPSAGFSTTSDQQVIEIEIGSFQGPDGENHLMGRMNRDGGGQWAGDGVRAAIKNLSVELARYNNFTKTRMGYELPIFPPPFPGEKFTLICGQAGNPRRFQVLRGGTPILTHTESGSGSVLGATHRGVGFGGRADTVLGAQGGPAKVRRFSAGDNNTESQAGHLTLTNIGEIEQYPQILFEGPGTLKIGNGPSSTEMISFGPLLEGQKVLINTHPRYRSVVDLTTEPVGQQLNDQQKLVQTLVKLVAGGQVPPALQWFQSMFGITPPQGALYELLDGRFTRPIPGVPQPREAQTQRIPIEVVGGNASTKVTASVTPMRRWPEAVND